MFLLGAQERVRDNRGKRVISVRATEVLLYNSFQHLDGWMDDLRFYVLFNSISDISGRWADDYEYESLCAMEPRLWFRRFRLERARIRDRWISRPALNSLSSTLGKLGLNE